MHVELVRCCCGGSAFNVDQESWSGHGSKHFGSRPTQGRSRAEVSSESLRCRNLNKMDTSSAVCNCQVI